MQGHRLSVLFGKQFNNITLKMSVTRKRVTPQPYYMPVRQAE